MEKFQISRTTLWNLERSGKIKPVMLGARSPRYTEEQIESLLQNTK